MVRVEYFIKTNPQFALTWQISAKAQFQNPQKIGEISVGDLLTMQIKEHRRNISFPYQPKQYTNLTDPKLLKSSVSVFLLH